MAVLVKYVGGILYNYQQGAPIAQLGGCQILDRKIASSILTLCS